MLLLTLLACTDKDTPDTGETAETGVLPAPDLVPLPSVVTPGAGMWRLDPSARIVYGDGGERTAEQLASMLRPATGYALPVLAEDPAPGDLALKLEPGHPDEGYTLDVTPDGATLAATDEAGLYYATQTLRQLLPPTIYASAARDTPWDAPAVHIEDAPRFEWRGGMLDVARHFFDVPTVERQIDLYAAHKLNRLHLHLTDDQGWRIEIRSWPDLTRIGGSTEVGGGPSGFYTQAEFVALAEYAAERHVQLIPEIDLPGHANAALASYPELNPGGVAPDLYTGESVLSAGLWLDGPATAGFVTDVWDEVAALTPGGVVHLGGDEVQGESLADYAAFVQMVQSALTADGKEIVGWDEIGTASLSPPFVAQYWYDAENAHGAVDDGGRIIASPAAHTYLDMMYDASGEYGQVWAGLVNVEAAYDWDPVLPGMTDADVSGVEGALWTEFIDTEVKVDFMSWPRLCALAEVGWTGEDARDWDGFRARLPAQGERLDALGVGYYRSPEIDWTPR